MNDYYSNSQQHIADELLLVDVLLHGEVVRHRAVGNVKDDGFQGLYIAEEEIDALLGYAAAGGVKSGNARPDGESCERLKAAAADLKESIDRKVQRSLEKGVSLTLFRLAALYDLAIVELQVLTICLAVHVDTKYQRLFAYLQDDVTRKNPTVALLLALPGNSLNDTFALRSVFSRRSVLLRENLLEYVQGPYEGSTVLPTRQVALDGRIADYLLDCGGPDERLENIVEVCSGESRLEELALPRELVDGLREFVSFYRDAVSSDNFLFLLSGSCASLKREVASAICGELGVMLLVVDLRALHGSALAFQQGIILALRESRLLPAALYFEGCEFLFEQDDAEFQRECLLRELDTRSLLSFLSAGNIPVLQDSLTRQRLMEIDLPLPDYELRREIWSRCLSDHVMAEDLNIREIAAKYTLTRKQIIDVVATASGYALWRFPRNPEIIRDDIRRACLVHSNRSLNKLAQRIVPKYRWDDIVLGGSVIEQLKEIVEMVAFKPVVHDKWGFDRKLTVGKGISALFHGESGTGKTMAANIIANELGMELYKIDISTVVSKYIGETEKNLSRIFHEAENSNAVLFFDEADALFGKRTEVKDSHDRYSNIEVSYLLQRIDEFGGIVILATNFNQNMDEAFERRLRFIVHFPFPDERARLQIWQNVFPEETQLDQDIDFLQLASKLSISGGNIANIALTAAFYAVKAEESVNFEHLLRACRSEYRKTGRLWSAEELRIGD